AIPFKPHIIKNGAEVKAVDYDLGINGVAYLDTDTADYHISNGKHGGNRGRVYRNDGVDITTDPAAADNYIVNHTAAGEWLQYTLNVIQGGHYKVKVTYNAEKENGAISLYVNNSNTKKVTVPKGSNWQALEIKDVELKKGPNTLRIYIDSGEMNLRSLQFTAVQ
ncbi:MAG TPA: carbohydrate-binding domain-containing protein, partial [Niastella sp.]|nr:carbohydrate-binding domain-containing protein [Niastella sp.]